MVSRYDHVTRWRLGVSSACCTVTLLDCPLTNTGRAQTVRKAARLAGGDLLLYWDDPGAALEEVTDPSGLWAKGAVDSGSSG